MHPRRLRSAAALWIVAGLWYLTAEAVAAAGFPHYSYCTNYVSDLGRPLQSPSAAWMNAAFIAQGLAFALAAALVVTTIRRGRGTVAFLVLAVAYGTGSAVVGVLHSGGGDASALAHVGGAVTAIVAGNLAVLTAGGVLLRRSRIRAFGLGSCALGMAGLLCGALLLSHSALGVAASAGATERGAVYTIIAWQLLAGAGLLHNRVGIER